MALGRPFSLPIPRRRRPLLPPPPAAATAAAAARRECERRSDGRHDQDRHARPLAIPPHVPSLISYVCSGRHESRTRFPCSESASCEDVSTFWRATTSSPPPSSWTM